MKNLLLLLLFAPSILFSQSRKERKALEAQQKADQIIINNLKSHIQNLTTSKTTGPAPATEIESTAVEYVSNQFKALGLIPKGSNGYVQPFSIDNGKIIAPTTHLKVDDKQLEVNKEYFPLAYSAEKKVTGTPAMEIRERAVPWFVDIKE